MTEEQILQFIATRTVGEQIKFKWRSMRSQVVVEWKGYVMSISSDKKSMTLLCREHSEEPVRFPPSPQSQEVLSVTAVDVAASADYECEVPPRVVFHDAKTWEPFVNPASGDPFLARRQFMTDFQAYFRIYLREQIPYGASSEEHDKTAMSESIEEWIKIAQELKSWTKLVPIIQPLLIRLVEHQLKSQVGAQAPRRFRAELESELNPKDKISVAIAKARKPGQTSKNDLEASEPRRRR